MTSLRWWQSAVFYQIYPRSFADGNGDGIGDFPGITAKLDHLRDLGVDAIWLSPHFPSPQADCGYDISDYTGVAPEYGTLDDFRRFLEAAHARGLKVVLDLVMNHTSVEHAWFQESRASRDNPRSEWYIWRDPAPDGGPPNNWASPFAGGGSAWEYEPARGQYYYHFFLREQPDLNWRNPAVKQAMWDAVRFWLDMGVDGFRLDAIGTIFEHPDFPNHESSLTIDDMRRGFQLVNADEEQRRRMWQEFHKLMGYQMNQPGLHELMRELRAVLDEYPGDRVLIGEDDDLAYHGSGDDELHLVFNFPLMRTRALTPAHVRANQAVRHAALPPGAWPCNTLGNHDSPRMLSRYGDGAHDEALARVHTAMILTLWGTPFLYNGEEIGMADLVLTELSQFRDEMALAQYRTMVDTLGVPPAEALAIAAEATRDRCRTPMQWSDAPNAGFSPAGVATWLPVHPNHAQGVSVVAQHGDPASMLSFYRRLLAVRRATPALVGGAYQELDTGAADVLAFLRSTPAQQVLVALNLGGAQQAITLPLTGTAEVLYSSHGRPTALDAAGRIDLAPFEILIADRREPDHG